MKSKKRQKRLPIIKKQTGSGASTSRLQVVVNNPLPKISEDIMGEILSNFTCGKQIKIIGSLDKNTLNTLVSWGQLKDTINLNISNDVRLFDCALCSMLTNESQKNDCKRYYHSCRILHLYKTYIGEYNKELIDINVLNNILLATIPVNNATYVQDYLIQLGANLDTIPRLVFGDEKLTSVTIPKTITTIGPGAFLHNELTNVVIPNSVTTIGNAAFNENKLTNIVIPNSVTKIGSYAFSGNKLTNIVIPNSVTIIGEYAFNGNKLTNVVIPNSVTKIDLSTFASNLIKSVTIGDSVTEIASTAFADNPLGHITLPRRFERNAKDLFRYGHTYYPQSFWNWRGNIKYTFT